MDTIIDTTEATDSIRKFLRKWIFENLPRLSIPSTKPSELTAIRNIPASVVYDDGVLYFDNDLAEDLFNEIQYGSSRWPSLGILDAVDAHLVDQLNKSFET